MALQETGIDLDDENSSHTLWLDVERLSWSSDINSNRAFVKGMIDEVSQLPSGTKLGVYTNYYNWQDIVGLDWDYASSAGLNLWYAHYDNSRSFSDFKTYGGWTKPVMKQYLGDKSSCGVGLDYNLADKSFFEPVKTATEVS